MRTQHVGGWGVRAPEPELDVLLSVRRGCSIALDDENRKAVHVGPKLGVSLDLKTAHEHKQTVDEYGRIEELWERRNALNSTWQNAKDHGINMEAACRPLLQKWDAEDVERERAGEPVFLAEIKAGNPSMSDSEAKRKACEKALAVGPVILSGRKYRDPWPGEKVPNDQLLRLQKIKAAEDRQALGGSTEAIAAAVAAGVAKALELVGAKGK